MLNAKCKIVVAGKLCANKKSESAKFIQDNKVNRFILSAFIYLSKVNSTHRIILFLWREEYKIIQQS